MTEKLIIKNFGPIKDVELKLGKFNVLIGDQGTGKSTIAKLYSLLKNFISIKFFNEENEELENNLTWQFEKYLKTFELESFINENTYFYYLNSRLNTTVEYNNSKLETQGITYASMFDIPRFTYIVAERVFISVLSDALYGINETGAKLPTLFNRFGNIFSKARKEIFVRKYKSLIGVDFEHRNGVDFIRLNSETLLPLSVGSSGVQSTIPMLVVFDSLVDASFLVGKKPKINEDNLFVIEEPELNLFPETQKKILNYIISNNFYIPFENLHPEDNLINIKEDFANKKNKNTILLTTHSPYILTSLNNLMYAYKVGQNNKEEVNKIIQEKYWVNPEDVSAYQLLSNGTAENIIAEDGLIKAENIDAVSREINEEYDLIQDIKIDFQNKTN